MSIKINKLEIENIKRVKAVKMEPSEKGLTIVGGNNNQGKTSILDAIAWALGGDRYKPSSPKRDDSVTDPFMHVELSNGLIAERKGKNSDLKVIDPSGNKAGQSLLNDFVEQFALDVPKFINANDNEKAKILLNIIGVGEELFNFEKQENDLYNQRLTIGQIADQKKKFAKEMEIFPEAPKELISAADLIKEQQEILAKNGENQKKRNQLNELEKENIKLKEIIEGYKEKLMKNEEDLIIARKTAIEIEDQSTADLEKNIKNIEEINTKVRANLDREKAEIDADDYKNQYDSLTEKIKQVRSKKMDLLNGANFPLEGLRVEEGNLTYKSKKWDNLSGSDQLKVATAIVRKLNPNCGFVLMDKLEQMDQITLKEFGEWLEKEDLQVIATRVSTGDECSIIIEDGYAALEKPENDKKWKEGEF